jgi:hypothetical protein
MPIVSTTTKKRVNFYQDAFNRLDSLIAPLLNGKEAENEFIYELDYRYFTEDGPAMIAVAQIGNSLALYAPEYLNENQLVIFEFFLRAADSKNELIVFSQKDYDTIQRYLYGKEVDIKTFF